MDSQGIKEPYTCQIPVPPQRPWHNVSTPRPEKNSSSDLNKKSGKGEGGLHKQSSEYLTLAVLLTFWKVLDHSYNVDDFEIKIKNKPCIKLI